MKVDLKLDSLYAMDYPYGDVLVLQLCNGQYIKTLNAIEELKFEKDKTYSVEIKPKRKARSMNANAYMWVLCGKIAEALGVGKEDVYREQVINRGYFYQLNLIPEAVSSFIKTWADKGIGWFAVDMGLTEQGDNIVHAYYGSSCYDTHQMSQLIDGVVNEAWSYGIETMTPDEIERLKVSWNEGK